MAKKPKNPTCWACGGARRRMTVCEETACPCDDRPICVGCGRQQDF